MEEITDYSYDYTGTIEVVEIPEAIRLLVDEFEAESLEMQMKIHELPASLADIGDEFVIPMALAIGPYHYDLPRLQGMEKAKRVAAYTLVRGSGLLYREMYRRVRRVAERARSQYAIEAVSGINPDLFADMMFHDACFLLQYMKSCSRKEEAEEEGEAFMSPLQRFLLSNKACIDNDIMLLENQLPLLVIGTLAAVLPIDVDAFIGNMRNSM